MEFHGETLALPEPLAAQPGFFVQSNFRASQESFTL